MNKVAFALTGSLICGALVGGSGWAEDKAAANAVTMSGTFVWNGKKGKKHELKAVFTPAGQNKWTVAFTAKWGKGYPKYTGTAEGDLRNGKVTGEAQNAKKKRKWTFTGAGKDGTLTCSHAEIKGKNQKQSGSFTIKAD